MIIKLSNLNFMNSWDLWAPRNDKALKAALQRSRDTSFSHVKSKVGINFCGHCL